MVSLKSDKIVWFKIQEANWLPGRNLTCQGCLNVDITEEGIAIIHHKGLFIHLAGGALLFVTTSKNIAITENLIWTVHFMIHEV